MTFDISASFIASLIALALIGGCITEPSNPAATQPATALNPATTQPSYWYDQPAKVFTFNDFDALWSASEDAARDFQFKIDRTDYRGGVMTTQPMTSKQWFEIWRPDVRTIDDLAESSSAAIRRTIRFEFTRLPSGGFEVSPKVLIERESIGEQRITSVVGYRGVFTRPVKQRDRARGTRESDAGLDLPWKYWYPTGRDAALEDALVASLQRKLAR